MSMFVNELAEISVLYNFINDTGTQEHIPELVSEDFYADERQKIFAVIQMLYIEKKQIDLAVVGTALMANYGAQSASLVEAAADIATTNLASGAWAMNEHIRLIKDAAMRRRLYTLLNSAKKELENDGNETDFVLDKTRQSLRDLVTIQNTWKTMSDVLMDTYNELDRRAHGSIVTMPSGLSTLDIATTGFHRGEVTIIGARPGVGKSALGAQIALASAKQGFKVAICSREMTSVQYGSRVISQSAGVDGQKLRVGNLDADDWTDISHAMSLYSALNVSFMFGTRYVEDLRAEVQKRVDTGELDLLVVDYMQLMQTKQKFQQDYLRIGYVSKMLKDMSTDLNICVIALAQVGRAAENAMPTMAELRGSGDIEQDADNIIFLHKPTTVEDKSIHRDDKELFLSLRDDDTRQYIVLEIAKQRQGQTGRVAVVFQPNYMRYIPIDRRAK